MQKVLILSYFFPPANFVGADRTAAWAKYLHKYGYFPIIITRQWNEGQTNVVEEVNNNELEYECFDEYEVYRLPYKYSMRDSYSVNNKNRIFQKALTFRELFWSNYRISALPYSNMLTQARKILTETKDIVAVISSGKPFQSFSIGHQLKKEFDVLWIPDYRDEWTTHKEIILNSPLKKLVNRLEKKSEIKWTSNADAFLTVSDHLVENISSYINKKGYTVLNGYTQREVHKETTSIGLPLKLIYSGTLYQYQNLEIILDAIEDINCSNEELISLTFVGVNLSEGQAYELSKKTIEHKWLKLLPRINKKEHDAILDSADVLFLTSYEQNKGWYPVKLFEYYNSEKPILVCPADNDVIDKFIIETNSGFIAENKEVCISILNKLIEKKKNGHSLSLKRNIQEGQKYSRDFQTSILAGILNEITK